MIEKIKIMLNNNQKYIIINLDDELKYKNIVNIYNQMYQNKQYIKEYKGLARTGIKLNQVRRVELTQTFNNYGYYRLHKDIILYMNRGPILSSIESGSIKIMFYGEKAKDKIFVQLMNSQEFISIGDYLNLLNMSYETISNNTSHYINIRKNSALMNNAIKVIYNDTEIDIKTLTSKNTKQLTSLQIGGI